MRRVTLALAIVYSMQPFPLRASHPQMIAWTSVVMRKSGLCSTGKTHCSPSTCTICFNHHLLHASDDSMDIDAEESEDDLDLDPDSLPGMMPPPPPRRPTKAVADRAQQDRGELAICYSS